MPDDQLPANQAILTEADKLIRRRFEEQNMESDHMLLAVTPEGAGIIRSSWGPEQLKAMSEMQLSSRTMRTRRSTDNGEVLIVRNISGDQLTAS